VGATRKPPLKFFTFVFNTVIEHDGSDETQTGGRMLEKDTKNGKVPNTPGVCSINVSEAEALHHEFERINKDPGMVNNSAIVQLILEFVPLGSSLNITRRSLDTSDDNNHRGD
jgi:hypothetical protein